MVERLFFLLGGLLMLVLVSAAAVEYLSFDVQGSPPNDSSGDLCRRSLYSLNKPLKVGEVTFPAGWQVIGVEADGMVSFTAHYLQNGEYHSRMMRDTVSAGELELLRPPFKLPVPALRVKQ